MEIPVLHEEKLLLTNMEVLQHMGLEIFQEYILAKLIGLQHTQRDMLLKMLWLLKSQVNA